MVSRNIFRDRKYSGINSTRECGDRLKTSCQIARHKAAAEFPSSQLKLKRLEELIVKVGKKRKMKKYGIMLNIEKTKVMPTAMLCDFTVDDEEMK